MEAFPEFHAVGTCLHGANPMTDADRRVREEARGWLMAFQCSALSLSYRHSRWRCVVQRQNVTYSKGIKDSKQR
jgi:hypothetical protein